MCHLPLTKGEVGASTIERSSFLSDGLQDEIFVMAGQDACDPHTVQ